MGVCLETNKEQTRGFGFGGCLLGLFFTVNEQDSVVGYRLKC
jgi:hypothetical protein